MGQVQYFSSGNMSVSIMNIGLMPDMEKCGIDYDKTPFIPTMLNQRIIRMTEC
jgi:hypothetical protein